MAKIQWVSLSFGVLVVFELRVVFDLETVKRSGKGSQKVSWNDSKSTKRGLYS